MRAQLSRWSVREVSVNLAAVSQAEVCRELRHPDAPSWVSDLRRAIFAIAPNPLWRRTGKPLEAGRRVNAAAGARLRRVRRPPGGHRAHPGIEPKTLRRHFRAELDRGAVEDNAKVAQSLFRMATQGRNVAGAISWLKARAGWREKQEVVVAPATPLSQLTDEQLNRLILEGLDEAGLALLGPEAEAPPQA